MGLGAAYLALKRQANQISPLQGEGYGLSSGWLGAEIVDALLEILEPAPEADVETAWRQEVAARVAALEAGEVETTPWEKIRDRFMGPPERASP
jgi:putative addiction module component (TIGR02574 family)